jgi:deazaflavin-dependent oxidoreductase (nitroreductase family)
MVLVGNSGSGKSTLSRQLASAMGVTPVELDSLVWARAQMVIWFDLPAPVVTARIVRRTLRRVIHGEELWNGNREEWRNLVCLDPERNIIVWSITQHRHYRERYLAAVHDPANAHLQIIRLRHRHDGDRLLRALRDDDTYTLAAMTETTSDRGIPLASWGSPDGAIARAALHFAATPAGAWLIRTMVPLDRAMLLKSDGRFTVLGPFGTPLVLLTTTGSISGQARTTPLVALPDGDGLLVVGSNFGQAHHPAWSTNLLAHPAATVISKGRRYPVVATLLEDDEREQAWDKFASMAEAYRAYVQRTDRTIRVFRLSRVSDPS